MKTERRNNERNVPYASSAADRRAAGLVPGGTSMLRARKAAF